MIKFSMLLTREMITKSFKVLNINEPLPRKGTQVVLMQAGTNEISVYTKTDIKSTYGRPLWKLEIGPAAELMPCKITK